MKAQAAPHDERRRSAAVIHCLRAAQSVATGAVAVVLDISILVVFTAILVVVATGGGAVRILGVGIRAHHVTNPIWLLTGLVVMRYATRSSPIFGVRRWPTGPIVKWGVSLVSDRFPKDAARLLDAPVTGVMCLAIVVFLVKVLLAVTSPGFFSGDDVEVHEMTLGVLLPSHGRSGTSGVRSFR